MSVSRTLRTQYSNLLFDIPADWANAPLVIELSFHRATLANISAFFSCNIIPNSFHAKLANPILYKIWSRWGGYGYIMKQALARAGITKSGVCLHSLRHSFASHLLAIHTDVVTVQKLMGHDDIRSTMEYFHLGNRPNLAPRSPLDTIYPKS